MPRSAFFSKEEIVEKALQIVREKGEDALSARSLSKALNCSISPIFTIFKNMEEVSSATREAARKLFSDRMDGVDEYEPAFKEFGIRLIRFAREENNLYHYLFLQKRSSSEKIHPQAEAGIQNICREFGITDEQARFLLRQIWIFSCGLAMLCTKDEAFTDEAVSEMLSIQFTSTVDFIKSGKRIENIIPHKK